MGGGGLGLSIHLPLVPVLPSFDWPISVCGVDKTSVNFISCYISGAVLIQYVTSHSFGRRDTVFGRKTLV